VLSAWITPRPRRFSQIVVLLGLWGLAVICPAQISSTGSSTSAPNLVSGQVVNASTGMPIARALVRFNQRAVLTDHDGNFQFPQNTDTSGNVLVAKPGYYATLDSSDTPNLFLQAVQLASPLRLLLYPEALLTGTITAPDGTPLPRIMVTVRLSIFDENGHRLMPVGFAQSDSHGNFRLPVQAGDYVLDTRYSARDETTGLAVLPVSIPEKTSSNTLDIVHLRPGEEQHLELRPGVGPTHTVSLAMDTGSGSGPLRFSAQSRAGTFQLNPTFTRATGVADIELPQGTYTLTVRRNNPGAMELAEATVTVPDHDVAGVALHFSPTPTIPVELLIDPDSTSDNTPPALPQLNLTLQSDQPDADLENATIRLTALPNQSFVFTPLPGNYHIQARSNGEWYVKSVAYGSSELLDQSLVVPPGSSGTPMRVTISNQMGSLTGTVKLKGVPSSCWIYLIATTPSAQPVRSFRSSSDGSYNLNQLPPGSYRVIAFERRHSTNYRDPATLSRFSTWEQSVSIKVSDKATLDLDAVPAQEMLP
jgi:hypothetical protein